MSASWAVPGPTSGSAARCPLAATLAERLRQNREELVGRWLERIAARVNIDPNRIFPSEELLDHVPLLVDSIADYLQNPADEISADAPLLAKAMELGTMRHEQGFEVYEILKEYEILGGILFHHLTKVVDEIDEPCTRGELLNCGHRLFRAVAIIQENTSIQYMRLAHRSVAEREERLRAFGQALSHEVRGRLNVVRGAVDMLIEDFIVEDQDARRRFHAMAVENVDGIERTTANLIELSRLEAEARAYRHVLLPEAVFEVTRQLRHLAESQSVKLRTAPDLPRVEVPASAVEHALTNYLSNAIKYHDPDKSARWAEVRAWVESDSGTGAHAIVVAVADNGVGVAPELRDRLFSRFYRANETESDVEGTGLGLFLVQETVEALGGRAWADWSRPGETIFAFSLPCRRACDPEETG